MPREGNIPPVVPPSCLPPRPTLPAPPAPSSPTPPDPSRTPAPIKLSSGDPTVNHEIASATAVSALEWKNAAVS